MPEVTSEQQTHTASGESPGGKPMGAVGITLITIYLVVVATIVIHSLVVLWPPLRDEEQETQKTAQMIAREVARQLGQEVPESTPGTTTEESETPGTEDQEAGGTTDFQDTGLLDESAETETTPMGTDMESNTGGEGPEQANQGEECKGGGQLPAKLFWFDHPFCLSPEERLFLIVMFSGALGGLVHSLRSFYWYAGNRKLVLSWSGFYITLPVLGATLATVFYLVVRGGFFSPQSTISDTSPFGFAALAALIGMFTEQAIEKLRKITETIFSEAPKGKDRADATPAAAEISPKEGPQTGGTKVTIKGKGFAQGATVTFGGQAATNVQVASDGTSITADTPTASKPGPVTVEVNSDGKKASLPNGFTYV